MAVTPVAGQKITNTVVNGAVVGGTVSISATFTASVPVVGNLMSVRLCGTFGPWLTPSGWIPAAQGGGNLDLAIFVRQVQLGDTKGPYTFAQSGGVDSLEIELMEWTGFSVGTIGVDVSQVADTSSGNVATVTAGSMTAPVELVLAVVGVGSTNTSVLAAGTPWSQGLTTDSAFVGVTGGQMATAHLVTTAAQAFSPLTCTWTGAAHSSTLAVASLVVTQSLPALNQLVVTGTGAAGVATATLATAPTALNMLVARCSGSSNGGWQVPANWLVAAARIGNLDEAILYHRVVAGDPAAWTFTETGGTVVNVDLSEWAALPGTPVPELVNFTDVPSTSTVATVPLGTTLNPVELVIAMIGVGGSGATQTAAWTGPFVQDTPFLGNSLTTAHLVLGATQAVTATVGWTVAHSATILAVSFSFVPAQTAIAAVYRGFLGFAVGQSRAGPGDQVVNAAAATATPTDTLTPSSANNVIATFAATVSATPMAAQTTAIVGGAQEVAVATSSQGLNLAATLNDGLLPVAAATTWTFAGNNAYSGVSEILALSPFRAPDAPTGVSVVAGNGQLQVTWVDPAFNGGSAIIDYTATATASGVPIFATVSGAPSTTVTITGLSNGTAYTVTVTARNALGSSVPSGSVVGTPATAGVETAMTANLASTVIDLGVNGPFFAGTVASTYGDRADNVAAEATAELALDARYHRVAVLWNGTNLIAGAAGGPGNIEALIQTYYGWGHRLLICIGPFTGYVNGTTTSIVNRLTAIGVTDMTRVDFQGPNEPSLSGHTVAQTVTQNLQIRSELVAILPGKQIWGPVWAFYDEPTFQTYMTGMGAAAHAGLDYHNYTMGTPPAITTVAAFANTPHYGTQAAQLVADATARGVSTATMVDEFNWAYQYADGAPVTPGFIMGDGSGNDLRFFSAINTVWMASACGWIMQDGGMALPYSTQNGPLGITVQSGNPNPDARPFDSPMPAYWGIGAWTGAGAPGGARSFSHMNRRFFATTSADVTTECFAVDNEAGGYNLVLINKRESATRNVQVALSGLAAGTWAYDQYTSVKANPYAAPVHSGPTTIVGNQITVAMGMCSVVVCVLTLIIVAPGAPTAPSAVAGNGNATVSFTAPASNGGAAIDSYRVTSTPANIVTSGASSPIVVSGLTNGTAYTFTVAAHNSAGYGPESAATAPVTPAAAGALFGWQLTTANTGLGGIGVVKTNLPLYVGANPIPANSVITGKHFPTNNVPVCTAGNITFNGCWIESSGTIIVLHDPTNQNIHTLGPVTFNDCDIQGSGMTNETTAGTFVMVTHQPASGPADAPLITISRTHIYGFGQGLWFDGPAVINQVIMDQMVSGFINVHIDGVTRRSGGNVAGAAGNLLIKNSWLAVPNSNETGCIFFADDFGVIGNETVDGVYIGGGTGGTGYNIGIRNNNQGQPQVNQTMNNCRFDNLGTPGTNNGSTAVWTSWTNNYFINTAAPPNNQGTPIPNQF